jgi:hypothetical protein
MLTYFRPGKLAVFLLAATVPTMQSGDLMANAVATEYAAGVRAIS